MSTEVPPDPVGQRALIPSGLTVKQSRFVVEYMEDFNATQAAIRAGYSPVSASVQASRNMENPQIQTAIRKAIERTQIRTEITQDAVLAELALLAFSDISNYELDDFGNLKPAENAPPGIMRAVSSIKRKMRVDKEGNVEREVEFRLWDKPGPLKLAGRHLGLFPSKDKEHLKAEAKALLDEMIEQAKAKRDGGELKPAEPPRDESKTIYVESE